MRTAIVADIHGNLTALEAVAAEIERRGTERVLHAGDLALAGAQPAEVVDRVRELGWPGVVGNVDDLLWNSGQLDVQLERAPKLEPLLRLLFETYAPATRELLGEERIRWLRGLPPEHREGEIRVLHASPGDLWRAPMPDAAAGELLETYGPADGGIVVYAHIHLPYVRRLAAPGREAEEAAPGDSLTVANTGSVGNPFDGDPRAAYLEIEDGEAETIRVPYDVEREVSTVLESGYPDAARIAEMRRRGSFVPVQA
jgi:diadenosine tetraphosphatase ApaH/serine/threonine PP2A family protein phosphatase